MEAKGALNTKLEEKIDNKCSHIILFSLENKICYVLNVLVRLHNAVKAKGA